jgi:hypothetical protein
MICQCAVSAESTSSSNRSATAPITGPKSVPMPPRITMNMISPDRVQCMKSGVRYSVWFASKAPASPPPLPAMTKAVSLYRSGEKPIARARGSLDFAARTTIPKREATRRLPSVRNRMRIARTT